MRNPMTPEELHGRDRNLQSTTQHSFSLPIRVMGILNVTPDSFSDGGRFLRPGAAISQARRMLREGADIIDVGGESTRPGAAPISVQQELDRTIPVIEGIRAEMAVSISIDTSHPQVMREAVSAGAGMINDVRALRVEGAMEMARDLGAPICLMHMSGEPRTMQETPEYQNVIEEVRDFLLARVAACEEHGIPRSRLWIDPGFGFGKTLNHNLTLLAHLDRFVDTGVPVLVGLSRKSMIGTILDKPVEQRLFGGIAAALIAAAKGAAILRVHDVGPMVDARKVLNAVNEANAVEEENMATTRRTDYIAPGNR
uniref:Dihydropteroate synthase n=1 Tax=Candidatus Kentrum sp. SD TaxID=2126332 RepID=A0A451BN09_9GAMM|nr:MAG: Dihydropteroate synthase [Candidatus Kentron sp. SD]